MSLRLRLLLTLAPLFILGLAAADVGTYVALQTSLLQNVDNELVAIRRRSRKRSGPHRATRFDGGPGPDSRCRRARMARSSTHPAP